MKDLIKTARKVVEICLEIKPCERVVLVKDHDSRIINAFEQVLDQYELVEISPHRSNSSPIPEATEAFSRCDVIIAPTKYSISHCAETTAARKQGARVATLPGITEEIFLKILECDIQEIEIVNRKVYECVKNARTIRITSPAGTDILLELDPRREWILSGMKCTSPGDIVNLPDGEIFCAPLETSAKGIIIIDRWGKITTQDRAQITVDNGRITSWNAAAKPYVDRLITGGERGLIIAELGIGTNKQHTLPIGNILYDEKIYHSCHIAFGENTSFGGVNKAGVHEDMIIMHPVILADGKRVEY